MTGVTPMVPLHVRRGGRTGSIMLKLESFNCTGSAKDRTALGLIEALQRQAPLRADDTVIESTSGNLGIAMAALLRPLGCRFVAVVDPNTSVATRTLLADAGAHVRVVTRRDRTGGYLLTRLRLVEQLRRQNGYRWTDQYRSPANPAVHEQTTGPELTGQAGPELDAVYVAVSTGGTLAGVSRHLRATRPAVRVVAVDTCGSIALHGRPGRRLLSGIGSSLPSAFLTPTDYDHAARVTGADAFAVCRILRAETGLAVGGSSGCALLASLVDVFGSDPPPRRPVCLMPDGGRNYMDTFYDDAWLRHQDLLGQVRDAERRLRAGRLSFDLDPIELENGVDTPHR